MKTVLLITGVALVIVATQGAIRLLVDHENAGVLGWVPGGFAVQLICYLVMACLGGLLAARNARGAATSDHRR